MNGLFGKSVDLIKAASENSLSLGAFVILICFALVYHTLRDTKTSTRVVGTFGACSLALIIFVLLINRGTRFSQGPHSIQQNGHGNVSIGNVNQSGSVNVSGVGGNVDTNVEGPLTSKGKHHHAAK